jgi:hypothetical protein
MLATRGYELVRSVLEAEEIDTLSSHLPSVERGGVRSLLDDPRVQKVARDPRLKRLTGPEFFAVRVVLFDKSPDANWALGWHQDLSIATRERREVDGFGPWTVKDGVPHTIGPASLLAEMVTLRLHLDDCGLESGPLKVKPGSHLAGRIAANDFDRWTEEEVCVASRGDVLVFKPLLLHASSASTSDTHRRVLQIEFAKTELPAELQWRWRI